MGGKESKQILKITIEMDRTEEKERKGAAEIQPAVLKKL